MDDDSVLIAGWKDELLAPLWEGSAHSRSGAPRAGHHWRWKDIERCALQAAKLTRPEVVERRVLRFVNPDGVSADDESTVGNLAAAIQVLLPGESARPHRHSINALRFILLGEGATTIVNGTAIPMRPGDVLLTPGDCWHEHRHDGGDMTIWLDIVDAPLNDRLGTTTFESGPADGDAPSTVAAEAFCSANVIPASIDHRHPYSPVFAYPYKNVVRALDRAPQARNGARTVRYINPLSGAAALSSIEIQMLGLSAGEVTAEHRSNASTICLIVEGEGESWIGEQHFVWSRHDVLTIPQYAWCRHEAHCPARMFVVSDAEALRRLDLYRENVRESPPRGLAPTGR